MLVEFNLLARVLAITTDNASNMVKCVANLQEITVMKDLIHVRCGAHVINLAVQLMLIFLESHIEKIRFFAKKVSFNRYVL